MDGCLMFSRQGPAIYFRGGCLEHVLESREFLLGQAYTTGAYLYVTLDEGPDQDVPEMVEIKPGVSLTFDGMLEAMFRFHDEDGTKYLLHRGDVNFIE